MRAVMIGALVFLGGCTVPANRPDAETEAYRRGYRDAVKEQYWIIQNQQREAKR